MHEILCIHFGPWTFLDRSIVTIPNRGGSRMNNDWFPKQTKKFGHALRGIFLDCTCNSRKSPFLCLRLISIKLWKPVWIRPSPTKKFVEVQEFTLVECISVHVLTLIRACSLRKVQLPIFFYCENTGDMCCGIDITKVTRFLQCICAFTLQDAQGIILERELDTGNY